MRVSEVGEFGLIALLAREFGIEYPPPAGGVRQKGLLVGLGDDAAVAEKGSLIWTTDTLVAGVHFQAAWNAWGDIGWKALAVNVSDIAAMGGTPDLALVTLALPADFLVEDAVNLYGGLRQATEAYGVTLAGGDIVRAPVFLVTVALSGWAATGPEGTPVALTRGAAQIGDVVAVTGCLGDSAGGLRLLEAGDRFETEPARRLRDAHLRPRPQAQAGRAAAAAGLRCAIDVSDGLIQDLGHVARASRVGIRIEASRLPLSDDLVALFPAQAVGLALSGGEDYELVFVGPQPAIDALRRAAEAPLTEIGEVVHYDAPRVAVVDETGREVPLGAAGWDHLRESG